MIRILTTRFQYNYDKQKSRRAKLNVFRSVTQQLLIMKLESGISTKLPTWRTEALLKEVEAADILQADIQIEIARNRAMEQTGLRFIEGIAPNHPITKKQIVKLYPECKKMPQPIAMDYVRDRA